MTDSPKKLLIRRPEITQLFGFSRQTLTRMEAKGEFPARVQVGQSVAWYRDEIEEWFRNLPRAEIGGHLNIVEKRALERNMEKVL